MNTAVCTEAGIKEVCDLLPCLQEKYIVDFANSIDVTKDHLRTQDNRSSFFCRVGDHLTGDSARRQTEINASLVDGVEGALKWLTELTSSVAKSNYALCQVSARIDDVQKNVAFLSDQTYLLHDKLEALSLHVESRVNELQAELSRVDLEQSASRQLQQQFDRWKAGHFNQLPVLTRCYVVAEELRWGAFGDCVRAASQDLKNSLKQQLMDKLTVQLAEDLNASQHMRVASTKWMAPSEVSRNLALEEGIQYLGEWADSREHPFVCFSSQPLNTELVYMPRIFSSKRASGAFVDELFGK
ncbi:diguanylate cyclase regulator RdcB family protein [Pontibacterium granulatum]|uniref:diguanylate cyclase regulator RdcB family protein n=1 Tax=Pontibacterium granulatum TaxID=2036029 RepID=UPI00249C5166|nr:diguanylate cyclase regulator RdcB family protein [Pontibacterium granulatum]MDI3323403.1 diguanylate cyclase regulator RdcB family protein [Pontibacterium granulatum]